MKNWIETKHLNQAEIYRDNGKYVAIITDSHGTLRNIAPYNCRTRIDAEIAVREVLDMPLTAAQQRRQGGGGNMKCPICKVPMHRAGFGWSGSEKIQRYRCQKCGHTIQRKPAI